MTKRSRHEGVSAGSTTDRTTTASEPPPMTTAAPFKRSDIRLGDWSFRIVPPGTTGSVTHYDCTSLRRPAALRTKPAGGSSGLVVNGAALGRLEFEVAWAGITQSFP